MYLENRTVRLQLWDTAGQERFRSLIPRQVPAPSTPLCTPSRPPARPTSPPHLVYSAASCLRPVAARRRCAPHSAPVARRPVRQVPPQAQTTSTADSIADRKAPLAPHARPLSSRLTSRVPRLTLAPPMPPRSYIRDSSVAVVVYDVTSAPPLHPPSRGRARVRLESLRAFAATRSDTLPQTHAPAPALSVSTSTSQRSMRALPPTLCRPAIVP